MTDLDARKRAMAQALGLPDHNPDALPATYKVYDVTLTLPVVAHSEAQARKRAEDLLSFIGRWMANENGPHPAVRYLHDEGDVLGVAFASEEVNETGDLGASMVSDNEFLYDWWDPYSDVDYDPREVADRAYWFAEDET